MKYIPSLALLFLMACSSTPPSSIGMYGPAAVAQDISGSNGQAVVFRLVEFTSEEVFEAAKTAMLRLGYNVETKDEQKGKITGSGHYDCISVLPSVTMAIYVKQVSPSPESKFTVVLDNHDFACSINGHTKAANQLTREIQKVLATY